MKWNETSMKDLASTKKSRYLQALEQFEIIPNFWCSMEYFAKAGYYEVTDGRIVGIFDADDSAILPLINTNVGLVSHHIPEGGIWADLVDSPLDSRIDAAPRKTFLDYQYIYDPADFWNMEGKQWAVFRKNSRKFPKRFGEPDSGFILSRSVDIPKIEKFADSSLSNLKDDVIHDFDVMMKYLFFGENRLFTSDINSHEILGVSIWDENYKYINYRYCLCMPEPFLGEYLRLGFYKYISQYHKLVNDGGVLDRPGLKAFKDKLNPVTIDRIHSWK